MAAPEVDDDALASLLAAWPPADDAPRGDYLARPLSGTRLLDALLLPRPGGRYGVAVAVHDDGALETVPVTSGEAGWRRAHAGDGVVAALLAAGDLRHRSFALRTTQEPPTSAEERSPGVDQTNESVIVGGEVVVKVVRSPSRLPAPAPVLLDHLGAVGFTGIPRHRGRLTWRSPDDVDVVLAYVDDYLPGATDGWSWAVDDLTTHLEHREADPGRNGTDGACCAATEIGAALGRLAGRLHLALAEPSHVIAIPVRVAGVAEVRTWRAGALDTLRRAAALGAGDPRTDLTALRSRIEQVIATIDVVDTTPVLHTHGDLHVGQVLRWPGGLAVIDFDGNPTLPPEQRTVPQPAARDVASLRCSLDHVGRIADRRTDRQHAVGVERWIAATRADLLAAYAATLAEAGRPELLDPRLLPAFEVEQECRELVYAATFLPRWAYAPMGALQALLDPTGTSTGPGSRHGS